MEDAASQAIDQAFYVAINQAFELGTDEAMMDAINQVYEQAREGATQQEILQALLPAIQQAMDQAIPDIISTEELLGCDTIRQQAMLRTRIRGYGSERTQIENEQITGLTPVRLDQLFCIGAVDEETYFYITGPTSPPVLACFLDYLFPGLLCPLLLHASLVSPSCRLVLSLSCASSLCSSLSLPLADLLSSIDPGMDPNMAYPDPSMDPNMAYPPRAYPDPSMNPNMANPDPSMDPNMAFSTGR
jgi:hypothetical protein